MKHSSIITSSSDDLEQCAEGLVAVAHKLQEAALWLDGEDPEALRQQAIGVQAESMRAAMTALTVRGIAERLSTVARCEQSTEASHAE
jgi:hypothetical protein